MGAIRWSGLRGMDVLAGGGPGLTAGYGTPAYRLFFALSFSPQLFGSRRPPPPPLVPAFAADPPRPAPALTVVAHDPPILFSRTLELARIEEDHVELLAPVLFARARDVLLPQSRAVLDAAVSVLEKHPELSLVRVEGHTDGHGKAGYNLGLSKRRAKAVRLYLMQHGIGAERLQSDGFGSSRPIASNDTTEGRARNRRVEMVIVRREAVAGLPGSGE
jgi:outer membrane protein OmpA-like peptidoglycan-associated protein